MLSQVVSTEPLTSSSSDRLCVVQFLDLLVPWRNRKTLLVMNSYKYIIMHERMETLELLFPGNLEAGLVALSCFCASCVSFVLWGNKNLSAQHRTCTYKQLQVLMIFL